MPDGSERFVELETSLAFQQRLCEQLNQIVCEHTQQILALERSVEELSGRLKDIQQQPKDPAVDPAQERPPHY